MKVFGVIGWKNAGKTNLMERLVTEITTRGFSVSTIKHAHHSFDVDQPGKDSFRHRKAGAREVLLSSRNRWALMHETAPNAEPDLSELKARISPVDLLLVEGFKAERHAKIEVNRDATGHALIAPRDATIVAIASDISIVDLKVPVLDLNDTAAVADFLLDHVGLEISDKEPRPELAVKPLRDDCFALPGGVDWVPVDTALDQLRSNLHATVEIETIALSDASGRVLARDVAAPRSNPPGANSAVDGYGFAHASIGTGIQALPLNKGRAAAGEPFSGKVPAGQAIRILTGALVPAGVDTIVMQEDVNLQDGAAVFEATIKSGANLRKAGEDIEKGDIALRRGQRIGAPELALMAAVGQGDVPVFKRLRVGVLSTGTELAAPGQDVPAERTFDANRPMLLSMARQWGHTPVDLGLVGDDIDALRSRLDAATQETDVVLTSGGASAGDEDHVSALLNAEGRLYSWRIALKPGRPLALGQWKGLPIFGLPGNPVAAFVCTLIFARPACDVLSGGNWQTPVGFDLPAAFRKSKRRGRREYLRARLDRNGHVEVFPSEGSGRISGLSWADGLVELGDAAQDIKPGDVVRYIPFASFGL